MPQKKFCTWLVISLLGVHAGLLAYSGAVHSPTIDEVGHMAAGVSHWEMGDFSLYRVNPPLVRMIATVPVVLARPDTSSISVTDDQRVRLEHSDGHQFILANGQRSFGFFKMARWACIPFCVLGGLTCFLWARELYGFSSGILALVLWCFCPMVLGHGSLMTPDVGSAALGVLAAYLFWHWLKAPAWSGAFFAGLVLGLAELTKFTLILFFFLWPLLWLLWRLDDLAALPKLRLGTRWKDSPRQAAQLLVILFLAVFVINYGYGFEGSFRRLGEFQFVSAALSGQESREQIVLGNAFKDRWLGELPMPLPAHYLRGIDSQKRDFDRGIRSYLRGQWSEQGGWWYYYLYGLAVKMPLGTLFLFFLALAVTLTAKTANASWRDELFLLWPTALILTFVSSQTAFNHHVRYVLPIFPFVFIWISKVAHLCRAGQPLGAMLSRPRKAVSFLQATAGAAKACSLFFVLASVTWTVASSLWFFPHSMSYFNELVGGPKGGPNHLVDSNIDWGQDLFFLKRWLDQHPEVRPLGLAYFGYADPRLAGLEFTLPPKSPHSFRAEAEIGPSPPGGRGAGVRGPQPGWYAVSVFFLKGGHHPAPDEHGNIVWVLPHWYHYFDRLQPVAMAGYSIYIYHVSLEDANRLRREMDPPELSAPSAPSAVKN